MFCGFMFGEKNIIKSFNLERETSEYPTERISPPTSTPQFHVWNWSKKRQTSRSWRAERKVEEFGQKIYKIEKGERPGEDNNYNHKTEVNLSAYQKFEMLITVSKESETVLEKNYLVLQIIKPRAASSHAR